jgi:alanyl-tRNA synthetase
LCGTRALSRTRRDHDILTRASGAIGAAPDDLADRVTAMQHELREADRSIRKLTGDLAGYRAHEEYQRAQPDARGVRLIVQRLEAGSLDELRAVAHASSSLVKCAFVGVTLNPPQILFATSEDSGIDAGKTLKAALSAAGGRGGGSARAAQGTVPPEALESAIARLCTTGS